MPRWAFAVMMVALAPAVSRAGDVNGWRFESAGDGPPRKDGDGVIGTSR